MTYAGIAPVALWTVGWLGWAIRHNPLMHGLTKLVTTFEVNRKRSRLRRQDSESLDKKGGGERVVTGRKDLRQHYGLGVGLALVLAPYFSRQLLMYLTCEWDAERMATVCSTAHGATGLVKSFQVAAFVLAVLVVGAFGFLVSPVKDGPFSYLCKTMTKVSGWGGVH